MKDIYKTKPALTKDQEAELFKLMEEGTPKQREQAREDIINHNYGLVFTIASRYYLSTMPKEDLVQEGMQGLMMAADKFEYKRGYKFSTYAYWWIYQKIFRAMREQSTVIYIPSHAWDKISAFRKWKEECQQDMIDGKAVDGLEEAMESEDKEMQQMMSLASNTLVSLDVYLDKDNHESPYDLFEDKHVSMPSEEAEQADIAELLAKVLETVPLRYRRVLEMRFGLGGYNRHTLEEAGKILGVTRERVRQIEMKALQVLRHPSRLNQLKHLWQQSEVDIGARSGVSAAMFDPVEIRQLTRSMMPQDVCQNNDPAVGVSKRRSTRKKTLEQREGEERKVSTKQKVLNKLIECGDVGMTVRQLHEACHIARLSTTAAYVTLMLKNGIVAAGNKVRCSVAKMKVSTFHLVDLSLQKAA